MQSQQSIHSPSPRGRGLGLGIENLLYFYKIDFFYKLISAVTDYPSGQNVYKKHKLKGIQLEIQKKIVQVLDNSEAICADLNIGLPAEIEARQKQYEYYRERMLTFHQFNRKG